MKCSGKSNSIVLGINSAGYNTSSALLIDGKVSFASEEERLVREKRTRRFPLVGIHEALKFSNLEFHDLDAIAISWNPAVNLEAFNLPQSQRARYHGEIFFNVPNHLLTLKTNNSVALSQQMINFIDGDKLNIYYVNHHDAHASSFFHSPFIEAAIMVIDAFGEKDSVSFFKGKDNSLKTIWTQEFPHSLGSFYTCMTEFLGFEPRSDEWKVMGASAYGDPKHYYRKLKSTIFLKKDCGFELDLSYFNHFQFHRPFMYSPKLIKLLEILPNELGKPLTQNYYDLATATQLVAEDVYFHLLNQLYLLTKLDNVVLSGGNALNSVSNGKITLRTPFKNVFISPVPDDSGASLGAAHYIYNQIWNNPRQYEMRSNYFGPGYTDMEILDHLKKYKISYKHLNNSAPVGAKLIASGKIIGWFQGRLEFGDRALGNRSIVADPRDPSMKDKVNATVKYREPFRPFAPSILIEYLDEYFEKATATPFMEKVFSIQKEKHKIIPAVTHEDGTGRLQTVSKEQNKLYYELIDEFRKLTGIPLVLNTSFNLKGEPIVCSPQDALRTFYSSGLDALIMGSYLIEKNQNVNSS